MRVYLLDIDRSDPRWPPEQAEKMLGWLRTLILSCPIECRDSMKVEYRVGMLYDDTALTLQVYYESKLGPSGGSTSTSPASSTQRPPPPDTGHPLSCH